MILGNWALRHHTHTNQNDFVTLHNYWVVLNYLIQQVKKNVFDFMIIILQRLILKQVSDCSSCFYLSLVAGPARGPKAIKSFIKDSGSVHESISSNSLCMAACLKSQLLNGSDWYSVTIILRFSTSRLGTFFIRMRLHFSNKGRWMHLVCRRNCTTLLGLL